jgi:hypothetical protein
LKFGASSLAKILFWSREMNPDEPFFESELLDLGEITVTQLPSLDGARFRRACEQVLDRTAKPGTFRGHCAHSRWDK